MPQEIRLSQLGGKREEFEAAVASHVERLKKFSTEVGTPRPVAHPLVEASVQRISYPKADKRPDDFVADYVIVDDTPPAPPPLNLDDRKAILLASLRRAEQAAAEKAFPLLRRRLFNLKAAGALNKPEAERNEADKAIIIEFNYTQERFKAIELQAAEAEAALEDVTEDTIDSWQVPDFG